MVRIKAPVYGFFAGNDARIGAMIPDAIVQMKAAGKTFDIVTYDGAGHGFMRAGEAPDAKDADKKARADARVRWKTCSVNSPRRKFGGTDAATKNLQYDSVCTGGGRCCGLVLASIATTTRKSGRWMISSGRALKRARSVEATCGSALANSLRTGRAEGRAHGRPGAWLFRSIFHLGPQRLTR